MDNRVSSGQLKKIHGISCMFRVWKSRHLQGTWHTMLAHYRPHSLLNI